MKESVAGKYAFLDREEQAQRYKKLKQSGNMFEELDGEEDE